MDVTRRSTEGAGAIASKSVSQGFFQVCAGTYMSQDFFAEVRSIAGFSDTG